MWIRWIVAVNTFDLYPSVVEGTRFVSSPLSVAVEAWRRPVGLALATNVAQSVVMVPRFDWRLSDVFAVVSRRWRPVVGLARSNRHRFVVAGADRRVDLALVADGDLIGLQRVGVMGKPVPLEDSFQLLHHRRVSLLDALRLTDHQAGSRVKGKLIPHPVQVTFRVAEKEEEESSQQLIPV